MNNTQFDELLESVRDMERHMRGETVAEIRLHEFPEPDVKAIRERTGLSQDQFAHLIGIKAKTCNTGNNVVYVQPDQRERY